MKSANLFLTLSIFTPFTIVSTINSQCPPAFTFTGGAGDQLGFSVAPAGDVNSDGFGDLIVGAPGNDAGGLYSGQAYVYSGKTGDTIYVFTGEAFGDALGISVASAGDVNNDGFSDLIVGASHNNNGGPDAGRAYIFSAYSGDTIYTLTGEAAEDNFGWSVASAGDVNNDGFDDFIVGAFGNDVGGSDAGRAYVFSGLTGDPIYVFTGEAAGDSLGWSVASAGDVNQDNFDDIILGVPNKDVAGISSGRVYVFSGQTGDTLYIFDGEAEQDWFGNSVASAGDVDGDGFYDLIIGARNNDGIFNNAGRAYVFSGQNGDTIFVFSGEAAGDRFGWSVATAGDVNNDGFADLVIGAPAGDKAYVFSGQTGSTIFVHTGEFAGDVFGNSVASGGDVNNDGYDDIIVGAERNNVGGIQLGREAGRAYVFSGGACFCADANGDLLVNMSDVEYLTDYYLRCSTAPFPLLGSDSNCDGSVDLLDVTYLAKYLNGTGPAPCCLK